MFNPSNIFQSEFLTTIFVAVFSVGGVSFYLFCLLFAFRISDIGFHFNHDLRCSKVWYVVIQSVDAANSCGDDAVDINTQ